MDAIGGQEMLMPVVHPADIWREAAATTQSVRRWPGSRTAPIATWCSR